MNAIIKIGNLHYLKVLEELLFSKVQLKEDKVSLVKPSFFTFVELAIQIYQQFVKSSKDNHLQVFILAYFAEKYPSPFELYRHMFGFINMWKKYVESHQEARILLSMLSKERNSKECVKLFLKIRKGILKNLHAKIMQDILIAHQDLIAISHVIFSAEMKTYVGKKIQELFISLRKKSTYSDKLNGAVVCEFFMNCAQKFQRQELATIKVYYDKAPQEEQSIHQQILKRRTFKPLDLEDASPFSQLSPKKTMCFQESAIQNEPPRPRPSRESNKRQTSPNNFVINNVYQKQKEREDNLKSAKEMVNGRYSDSWQKFLKTNREMKQRLLRNHQQNM